MQLNLERQDALWNDELISDALSGMTWWNNLAEAERAHWAALAGTGVAADAWECFKEAGLISADLSYAADRRNPDIEQRRIDRLAFDEGQMRMLTTGAF